MTGTPARIWLPPAFTSQHQQAVLKHLQSGRWTLSRAEWRLALEGFGLLHNALAQTALGWQKFNSLYSSQIDAVFTDRYLADLLALNDVSAQSTALWASYAQAISAVWEEAGWAIWLGEDSQLLLAHWLYWWRAFAIGYAFEVQVFRDLSASGIVFKAHDIRTPTGRYSPYDLEVLGLYGDVKNSLYFLTAGRSPGMRHDFYISRFRQMKQQRVMVALMQPAAWQLINGDAELMNWATVRAKQPKIAKIMQGGQEIVLIAYDEWKMRVSQQQQIDTGMPARLHACVTQK